MKSNKKLENLILIWKRWALLFFFGYLSANSTTASDIMLGAYVSGDGWNKSNIQALNEISDNKLAFINLFTNFSYSWDYQLQYQANNIYDQGLVPLISLMPVDNQRKKTSILQEIIDGEWDTYLTQWARGLKKWVDSKPLLKKEGAIMLRFAHEFNATWYSYGNQPEALILAWQYVYDFFENENVKSYIQWIWCANNVNVDDVNDMTQYYPGDEYVDWTSIDGYNWGANYAFSRWKTFSETFANAYRILVEYYPDKPIMLAELGSTEPKDTPRNEWGQDGNDNDATENKPYWFTNMLETLPATFPAIRAISLFNINKELGWSINGVTNQNVENSGSQAWLNGINSGSYTTDYLIAPRFSSDQSTQATMTFVGTTAISPPIEISPSTFMSTVEQNNRANASPLRWESSSVDSWPWLNPTWRRHWCCYWFPERCIQQQEITAEDQVALAQGPKPKPFSVAEEKLESTGLRYANCKNNGLFARMKNRAETSEPEPVNSTSTPEKSGAAPDNKKGFLHFYCAKS